MHKFIPVTAAILFLTGCASSGTKVTQEQADQFVQGQTTKAQVIAALGQPNRVTTGPDGSTTIMYVHAHASANAASFIPVVGLLAGGATSTSESALFKFDGAGVLQSHTTSQGTNDVATGLLNQ